MLLLFLFPPLQLFAQSAPATVLDKEGVVVVFVGNLVTNVTPAMALPAGSVVRVVGRGKVRLQFANGCTLILGDEQSTPIEEAACPKSARTDTPALTETPR